MKGKTKAKLILSIFLALICFFLCGCQEVTNKSLYNVFVSFKDGAGQFFEWELKNADGTRLTNARKGDELILSVKRNQKVSDKFYYVSSVNVDGVKKYAESDGKGNYTLAFTMEYDALTVTFYTGVNEIVFEDESVKGLFDVYFTDENDNEFDYITNGEKLFLNIVRSENYDIYDKDYYVGAVKVNGNEIFSELQDVEHFKKEITLNEDSFLLNISGQYVYYDFSHPNVADKFDVIIRNESDERVGKFVKGEKYTVAVKSNSTSVSKYFVNFMTVDGEQIYFSGGGSEGVFAEIKSDLFELTQDVLTVRIVFGVDEYVVRP